MPALIILAVIGLWLVTCALFKMAFAFARLMLLAGVALVALVVVSVQGLRRP